MGRELEPSSWGTGPGLEPSNKVTIGRLNAPFLHTLALPLPLATLVSVDPNPSVVAPRVTAAPSNLRNGS
eukprot:gene15332-21416_t